MIDNNIIQSLGAGSGIDTVNLTKQLVEIERAAPQQRIDSKRDKAESQISDYGLLSNAMATLQDAAAVLSKPEGLFSKTASYTESNALVPVGLETDVQAGTYKFTVEEVAASQSLTSAVFNSVDDAVGEGVLTFRFGKVTDDGNGAMAAGGFEQDLEAEDIQITIDSSNNSLEGLRDAINDADFGVQASIVNNGVDGYVLQISAASGASNELEITVEEAGGAPSNNDNTGLSRFSFNETASQMTQYQSGADAKLTINGMTVYRDSNSIDDIVPGLKLDVIDAAPGVPVTITITDDKAFAEQNIRDFIEAFNVFLEAIEPAVGTYEKENEDGDKETVYGSLANDPLAKSMLSQIRSVIANAIPGLSDSSAFSTLGTIGIRTELDGTLSIDEETFSAAIDDHFSDIQKLFAPSTDSSSDSIYINSYSAKTRSGEFDVNITTAPSQGEYQGGALGGLAAFPDFDSTGQVYDFSVNVDGTQSGSLIIPEGVYADQSAMAQAIQDLINSDSTIVEAGKSVTVSYDSDNNRFDITSNAFGSGSNVSVVTASTDIETDLGIAVAAGTAGTTVAGTINDVSAFGSAQVLLPSLGQPGEGLALIVKPGATTGTVSFSRGFAGELESLLENFLGSNGLIATKEANLEDNIEKLDEDEERLNRRMTSYEERMMNQFIAMERIINGLNTSGSFLDNLINTLPFTASKD